MGKSKSKINMERRRLELMELARLNELLEPVPEPTSTRSPIVALKSIPCAEESTRSVAEPIAPKPDAAFVHFSQHPEVESQIIIKEFVIAFVEEVEKAHQYFLFKEYLRANCHIMKHNTNPHDLADELARENQGGGKFNLLELEEFKHCVKDYIFELGAKQYPNKDLYAVRTPIYYLVFRAREEGYVMDKDPEVELEKLKKFSPMFYRDCFVRREPSVEVEARTVTVSNISLEVSADYVRRFFNPCGYIEDVKMRSVAHGQIADITFRKLSEANYAQWRHEGRKVPGLSKRMKYPGSQFVPLLVRPKSVPAGNSAKSAEDVSSLLAAAHERYGAIRAYYSEFQSKACDQEEFRGGCHRLLEPTANWMVVEAMANGGYTPGGNVWQRAPVVEEMANDGYTPGGNVWQRDPEQLETLCM